MDLDARTLVALDWAFVCEALAMHARTERGRAAARSIRPGSDLDAVRRAFDEIDEVHALVEKRTGSPPVGGVEDLGDILVRASRGDVLDLSEVGAVSSTLGALLALQQYLASHAAAAPALARLGEPIDLDRRLCRTFDAALDEHGRLSEKTWPQLGELRRRIASLDRNMRTMLEGLLESPEYADLLQDRYVTVRGDRFVLPIKAQAKGLGLGIVHDASRSERTVFVEPAAVVPLGNQRRMAEAELRDEERRILLELSALLGAHAASLREALAAAALLDLASARADFAVRIGAVRPATGSDGVVDLRQARHPVLALANPAVVANDLRLDASRPVLVLTGPNAGGKTVAMKTIGLCALLARSGCFVPAAPGSRVDLFPTILADIGDQQTVHEGLSSFSAHLTTLRGMLEAAGPGSLLLLDEIAAGTDPSQGGALARAVIERLADVGSRVVATTHFTQVKAMGADDARVEVAALEYRDGRPTYRVVADSVGESHALAAAVRIGIDAALVDRARALMESGERALLDAVASLEAEKTRAAEAARSAEAAAIALGERERAVEAREAEIAGRAREIERKAAAAVVDRLGRAEDEVQRALAALREDATRQRAGEARAAIVEARKAAREAVRDRAAAPREPVVGDRVRVTRVGVSGEVVAMRGDEMEVRAGAMTVRARRSEVEFVSGPAPPRGQAPQPRARAGTTASPRSGRPDRSDQSAPSGQSAGPAGPAGPAGAADAADWIDRALRGPSNSLDLRGLRVDEGLERLQGFLDEAMLEGREVVFVLHGHGTGAMKSAIRAALSASPYISASQPAPEDQGGDAWTVSRLRG